MSTNSILSKIRQEIERLKNNSESAKMEWIDEGYNQNAFAEDCRIGSFDTLLSFLNTLSEEDASPCWKKVHTYTEELHEGDMEKMLLNLSVGKGERRTKIALPDKVVDTLSEEPSESLEEAAEEYAGEYPAWNDEQVIAKYAFKRGAEWQKSQMMKEAVEGIARIGYPFLSSNPFVDIQESKDSWCKLMRKFMDGDKVRIIVLKAEEE